MQQLARLGFTPNHITLLALIGSAVVGVIVTRAAEKPVFLLLLPGWLFVRMALNAIDGMMAREFAMASTLGAVLNELGDVLADLGLYLPLAFVARSSQWAVMVFVMGAVLTEFCGVLGRALGGTRHYEGPMGKSDRAFLIGALCLITFLFPVVLSWWVWIFGGAAILTVATCWNRISKALQEIT